MRLLKNKKWSQLALISILFFSFVTRFWRLHLPDQYIFDEVYHAVTAKLIAVNDPSAFEWWHAAPEPDTAIDWLHPPLAKYTQALGIKLFGANTFGWRFSSALFGVGVIYLVYRLSLELFDREDLALLASFLTSLDGLLLAQSRIAMNDIHLTFFVLLTLVLFWYWQKKLKQKKARWWHSLLVGLSAGFSLGTKWSGLFVVVIIWLFVVWRWLEIWFKDGFKLKVWLEDFGLKFLSLALIPALIYLASYGQMFLHGKDWDHFKGLHQQIWSYQTNLNATHPHQARPWQWFLNLRPMWIYVDYLSQEKIANIYAFGNPALFWLGALAVVGSLGYLIYKLVNLIFNKKRTKKKKFARDEILLAKLLLAYTLVWTPWFLSPRIMFFYHYAPAVPLMTIILSYWLLKLNKKLIFIVVGLVFACFVVWFPHWTGLPVSREFADKVYFIIPSWR